MAIYDFAKFHIYLNYDWNGLQVRDQQYVQLYGSIGCDHKFHVYMHQRPSNIKMFQRFIRTCGKLTRYKVNIHIPKKYFDLRKYLDYTLRLAGLENYQIWVEPWGHVTRFWGSPKRWVDVSLTGPGRHEALDTRIVDVTRMEDEDPVQVKVNSDTDPYHLFSRFRELGISTPKYVKCRYAHVFVNVMKYSVTELERVKKGHIVHIFLDSFMDPIYGDCGIFDFVETAHKITGRKVIIHIPRYAKDVKYATEAKLDGCHCYQIMVEKRKYHDLIYREKAWNDYHNYAVRIMYRDKQISVTGTVLD